MSLARAVSYREIRVAAERLRGVHHRTPVLAEETINEWFDAEVFFKCENLQRTGAFKFRGAFNAMSLLSGAQREAGVITFSSGNHAQAMALAAGLLGVRATIIMPSDAPRVKLEAVRRRLERAPEGSEVVQYERERITREDLARQIIEERGMCLIPPYDHPNIIAGQGTAAMELFEDVGELDWLFVCCGGGGLLSGSAICAETMSPLCRVVGVEPEAADDACRSFETRTLHTVENPETIADGARTPYLGKYTFPMVLQHVDEMLCVPDAALVEAMRVVMGSLKQVIEPTGGLGLAGLEAVARERGNEIAGTRVGVILSGGNVDLDRLAHLLGE